MSRVVVGLCVFLAVATAGCHERIRSPLGETAGDLPADVAARSGWAQQDGLNLTVSPSHFWFSWKSELEVEHNVTNQGDGPVSWRDGGCDAAWDRTIRAADGAPVQWQAPAGECEEKAERVQLAPGEEIEDAFTWNGTRYHEGEWEPVAAGHYQLEVTFYYGLDEGPERGLTAMAQVGVQQA